VLENTHGPDRRELNLADVGVLIVSHITCNALASRSKDYSANRVRILSRCKSYNNVPWFSLRGLHVCPACQMYQATRERIVLSAALS